MRKTIISLVGGALILLAGFSLSVKLSNSSKAPKKKNKKNIKTVVIERVQNKTLPIQINTTGAILAKDRAELFSEVQGVFSSSARDYKAGTSYNKGEALIRINQAEYAASVASQRSSFKSLVSSILVDIQFDYPEELLKWKKYANSINANTSLPGLPEVSDDRMNYYLTNKNIFSTYFNIKNLETRLRKYVLTAPFNGVLVSADITQGSLVSPGQKLGEFIRPGVYELELNINSGLKDFLKLGKEVSLSKIDHSSNFMGKVTRINPKIDQASQTIQLFVQINSKELTEGEYLQANINAKEVSNVYEIDRSLIVDENKVYIVEDGALKKQEIQIVHSTQSKLIVSGLTNESQLVSMPVPGAYEGLKVNISQ